jgi:hypothetical protein
MDWPTKLTLLIVLSNQLAPKPELSLKDESLRVTLDNSAPKHPTSTWQHQLCQMLQ